MIRYNIPTHAVMAVFGTCAGSVHAIQIPSGLISPAGQFIQLCLSTIGSSPGGHFSHLSWPLTNSLFWQGLQFPLSTSPALHTQIPSLRVNPALQTHWLVLHVFLWVSSQSLFSLHSERQVGCANDNLQWMYKMKQTPTAAELRLHTVT